MKLAIPDLVSNSYFTALAAAELGHFARHGLEIEAELIFPVDRAYQAMRDGEYDFVAGAAHGALAAFPGWRGCKLLGALAQGMYWFLVMRADLNIARGDLAALKGRRIGAAPWVERVHCFTFPAFVSHGPVTGDVPAISVGAERVANGVAGALFAEDYERTWRRMVAWDTPELRGDEYVLEEDVSKFLADPAKADGDA